MFICRMFRINTEIGNLEVSIEPVVSLNKHHIRSVILMKWWIIVWHWGWRRYRVFTSWYWQQWTLGRGQRGWVNKGSVYLWKAWWRRLNGISSSVWACSIGDNRAHAKCCCWRWGWRLYYVCGLIVITYSGCTFSIPSKVDHCSNWGVRAIRINTCNTIFRTWLCKNSLKGAVLHG